MIIASNEGYTESYGIMNPQFQSLIGINDNC